MDIQLHDKTFASFIAVHEIKNAVGIVANEINSFYKQKTPVILPVLDGAFVFAADLAKQLTIQAKFSFIKYKSYHNTQSTGTVSQLLGLDIDIKGQDVLLVEDIIDTGLTLHYLLAELKQHQPASIKIATLLAKPDALKVPLEIDFKGIEIPNRFVVGYGMDYNGLGRNLDGVYVLKEADTDTSAVR